MRRGLFIALLLAAPIGLVALARVAATARAAESALERDG